MMRNFLAIATISVLALFGCDDNRHVGATSPVSSNHAQDLQNRKVELLRDASGVWNPSRDDGLLTINYADNRFQMILGDSFIPVTLGDTDPDNETINLRVTQDGKPAIWTLRKSWNTDHSAYSFTLTFADGSSESLSFVRRVTTDDLNRIAQLSPPESTSTGQSHMLEAVAPQAPAAPNMADKPADNSLPETAERYLGATDMFMRSCPGTTCSALIVVPKQSKVSVNIGSIRNVTESSGTQTPWAMVSYSGPYCDVSTLDQNAGCNPDKETAAPVIGWMNYTRLSQTPVQQ
jgi:hypothetical protein